MEPPINSASNGLASPAAHPPSASPAVVLNAMTDAQRAAYAQGDRLRSRRFQEPMPQLYPVAAGPVDLLHLYASGWCENPSCQVGQARFISSRSALQGAGLGVVDLHVEVRSYSTGLPVTASSAAVRANVHYNPTRGGARRAEGDSARQMI